MASSEMAIKVESQLTQQQLDLIQNHMTLFEQIFNQQLREQAKTNQLLLMLIEAMGQEEADPDDEPSTYMDGTKVS